MVLRIVTNIVCSVTAGHLLGLALAGAERNAFTWPLLAASLFCLSLFVYYKE